MLLLLMGTGEAGAPPVFAIDFEGATIKIDDLSWNVYSADLSWKVYSADLGLNIYSADFGWSVSSNNVSLNVKKG